MINSVNNLNLIQNKLKNKIKNLTQPNIIAVSKTFPIKDIYPLINHGHEHFGENKIQESLEKWADIKQDFLNIKLHMIGKLQSNKVKYAVPLFVDIHSLDNLKLAEKISNEQQKINTEYEGRPLPDITIPTEMGLFTDGFNRATADDPTTLTKDLMILKISLEI